MRGSLPDWCATHSFKEFLELMEEKFDEPSDKEFVVKDDPLKKIIQNDPE
jgi:hypothetical protein